ncbi:MAG TPA: glycosyltransferase family 9 protein [Chthoniobacterales bacterium]|nr:glycosyltransferase family 9 protein [Chthoniobacterales bacterium]
MILSYLYDPDRIFEENVRKTGAQNFLAGPAKLDNREHAAVQLSRPLQSLGLSLADPAAQVFPSDADRASIQHFRANPHQTVALHPGSGSETKNWPLENWIQLGDELLANGRELLIVAGEADHERTEKLQAAWKNERVRFVENIPLSQLAALLEDLVFVGHDSGISHIAAAAGARCLLLFGWTDPTIWAPANAAVTVIRAPEGKMSLLEVETVSYALMRIGIRT